MLRLAEDFYLVSIENNSHWCDAKIEGKFTYFFRYKNYKLELSPSFNLLGYTKEDNIAILNFGYTLDIRKWSDKGQSFHYIPNLNNQDGSSTKQYFDSPEARELILRFIEKFIRRYLSKTSPAIIIRGALSDIKTKLPRYKRFDKHFLDHGYIKIELDITTADSLYKITVGKDKEDKEIWVYCKKESHFQQLSEVF